MANRQERQENTVRQQPREWCYAAPAKRGRQRQALPVEACVAPLLRWVLPWWHGEPTGPGAGCHHLGRPGCGLGEQGALPRLRHPGGVGRLARHRPRGPGKPRGDACCSRCRPPCRPPCRYSSWPTGGLYARWLFRAMVHRGWQPAAARQRGRAVSAPGRGALALPDHVCPAPGHPLAGPRHGVQDPPAPVTFQIVSSIPHLSPPVAGTSRCSCRR